MTDYPTEDWDMGEEQAQPMTIETKQQVLTQHHVDWIMLRDRLHALDVWSMDGFGLCEQWRDVHDWSGHALYMWLGY